MGGGSSSNTKVKQNETHDWKFFNLVLLALVFLFLFTKLDPVSLVSSSGVAPALRLAWDRVLTQREIRARMGPGATTLEVLHFAGAKNNGRKGPHSQEGSSESSGKDNVRLGGNVFDFGHPEPSGGSSERGPVRERMWGPSFLGARESRKSPTPRGPRELSTPESPLPPHSPLETGGRRRGGDT